MTRVEGQVLEGRDWKGQCGSKRVWFKEVADEDAEADAHE